MGEPLDLDAIAGDDDYPFTFGGEQFTLTGEPDVAVWELLNKGEFRAALYLVLGEEQYDRLDDLPTVLSHKRLLALFTGYEKHLGIEAPKSSGPNRQSRRTRVK